MASRASDKTCYGCVAYAGAGTCRLGHRIGRGRPWVPELPHPLKPCPRPLTVAELDAATAAAQPALDGMDVPASHPQAQRSGR